MPLAPHEQRVVDEAEELNERLTKLGAFLRSEMFRSVPVNEQIRLKYQHLLMREYWDTLVSRINNNFR